MSRTASVLGAFLLRRAISTDVGAIANLEKMAFSDPWSIAEFSKVVTSRWTIFLVAVESGRSDIAGYIVISTVIDEAEVLNLAVAPSYRGIGLGGMLLDAGLANAIEAGAGSVFLEVRESNAAARALYASRGFGEISRRKRYYGKPVEDALVLRWALQR